MDKTNTKKRLTPKFYFSNSRSVTLWSRRSSKRPAPAALACQVWIERLTDPPLIAIVDDDDAVRGATEQLLRSFGFTTRTFASAESFLKSSSLSETICLILDVQMPKMSGIELQAHLSDLGVEIPTIFITAYPDKTDEARALNAGAICFLRKPVDEQRLVECLGEALNRRSGPAPAA